MKIDIYKYSKDEARIFVIKKNIFGKFFLQKDGKWYKLSKGQQGIPERCIFVIGLKENTLPIHQVLEY